ncbi:MAG: organomercurial lyase [Clostridia bacterium]|nr:organomercurial lyase [Clostridia bacterium]
MADIFDGGLGQHLKKLTPEENVIRTAAFYRILDGNRSNIDDLTIETGLTTGKVQKTMKGLVQRGIMVLDEKGDVVGSHGLSLVPTEHRLSINGWELFTWCAADAVGIPAALGVNAKVSSKCFQCHNPIEIEMVNGEIRYCNREDACIWVIAADFGRSIVGCT